MAGGKILCILFKAQDDEAKRKLTPQGNLFVVLFKAQDDEAKRKLTQ